MTFKQIIIAMGEGAKASLSAFDHLIRSPAPVAAATPTEAHPPRTPPVPVEPAAPGGFKPHASPSVRRFARELGVDLGDGTPVGAFGPDGLAADRSRFIDALCAHWDPGARPGHCPLACNLAGSATQSSVNSCQGTFNGSCTWGKIGISVIVAN